jgi:hypothetical protein
MVFYFMVVPHYRKYKKSRYRRVAQGNAKA